MDLSVYWGNLKSDIIDRMELTGVHLEQNLASHISQLFDSYNFPYPINI